MRIGSGMRRRAGRTLALLTAAGLALTTAGGALAQTAPVTFTYVHHLAVVTDLADPARPCGACRQVLAEFGPSMHVFLLGLSGASIATSLDRLLPDPFTFHSWP